MCDLEQRGKENAARIPWMYGALPIVAAASLFLGAQPRMLGQSSLDTLPDAPSALLFSTSISAGADALPVAEQSAFESPAQSMQPAPSMTIKLDSLPSVDLPVFIQHVYVPPPPCPKHTPRKFLPVIFEPRMEPVCQDQLQLIVDTGYMKPLSSKQKGALAFRSATDPFTLLTIAFFSAVSIAANSHSAYGPGFTGWGKLSGYTFVEDAQTDFTGIFLIPSIVREDPRYHRMPGAPFARRLKHALIHTVISQHDDGSLMPNYATLINYPLTAEISNLYVPGVPTNITATAKRVIIGYASDPIDPLIAEFLPDVARHFHVHVVFMQQILNRIAPGSAGAFAP